MRFEANSEGVKNPVNIAVFRGETWTNSPARPVAFESTGDLEGGIFLAGLRFVSLLIMSLSVGVKRVIFLYTPYTTHTHTHTHTTNTNKHSFLSYRFVRK